MKRSISETCVVVLLLGTVAACSGGTPPTASPTELQPEKATNPASEAASAGMQLVTSFDPTKWALPEGLAIRGDDAYVGLAPTGEIVKVSLSDGEVKHFASLPAPVQDKGFMTGLEFGNDGNLYAALVSFVEEPQAGVYKVDMKNGKVSLFASHEKMKFPNGFARTSSGEMLVTDSGVGAVFKVDADGKSEVWVESAELVGAKDFCGKGVGAAFDIGANGIARVEDSVYVANNDKGTIVQIRVESDGTAGKVAVVAGPDCDGLGGADGLAVSPQGGIVVAANRLNRIVELDLERLTTAEVVTGGKLDFPASLSFHDGNLVITNFALFSAMSGKDPKPGLLTFGPLSQ